MRTIATLCCLCLLLGGPAVADDPENVAELKDTITGTVTVPGESLAVVFYAPAGTKLNLSVKKKGKPNPEVTLSLTGPDGADVLIEKKKAVAEQSGEYRLTMTAGVGLTGQFTAKVKGSPPNKAKFSGQIEDGDTTEHRIPFSVMEDTRLDYKLEKANPTSLYGPDGYELELFAKKEKGLFLRDAGDYELGIRGTGGKAKASLKFKLPEIEKRKVWLSNAGFGEAPEILSVDPAEGLSARPIDGVVIEGEHFDPGVMVELVRKKETIPAIVLRVSDEELNVSMDLTGATKGSWDLIITNPSGATVDTKFKVIKPGSVVLPAGIEAGTEIWYLDFNESFDQDLYEFGLTRPVSSGGSSAVNRHVRKVVQAYVLYWLRTYFALPGITGQVSGSDIPVSFVLDEAPTVAGIAGADYNRIEIGGAALNDAASDNPDLPWGNSPVDVGNVAVDDIADGGPGEATARVPVFEMRPTNQDQTTSLWRQTHADLVAAPVTDTDAGLFSNNPAQYLNRNDDDIDRYKLIVRTIEVLSKEIAAVTAHHVARAMGIENGEDGLMRLPALFGVFASEDGLSFTEDERTDLQLLANPMLLPGKSSQLKMKPFQMNPGQRSILTAFGGISNQESQFYPTGGRPDRTPEDMRYQVFYNSSAPLGVTWPNNAADGLMRASPPTYYLGTWYTDAVYFRVTATDTVDGRSTAWTHRLNVLIDLSQVTPSQVEMARDINEQVVSYPAR